MFVQRYIRLRCRASSMSRESHCHCWLVVAMLLPNIIYVSHFFVSYMPAHSTYNNNNKYFLFIYIEAKGCNDNGSRRHWHEHDKLNIKIHKIEKRMKKKKRKQKKSRNRFSLAMCGPGVACTRLLQTRTFITVRSVCCFFVFFDKWHRRALTRTKCNVCAIRRHCIREL